MRTNPFFKNGFLIPRMALALCLFLAATFLAFYSLAGPFSAGSVAAGQPPFPPVENRVTNGGLTLLAKVFSPNGKVKPGETFPLVLTYQAGGTGAANVTIRVTLHSASIFQQSTPAPASGNGTAGSPLVYTITAVAPNGTGQIVIEARAKNLTEDPEVMWKDISADVTLAVGLQGPLPARTHGPKVTTLESAVYGDRPFPVVMVQYQDVKHCTGVGTPFPECTGNHTSAALDTSVNSRTTGKSVWQLYQDMSFGQLFPDGRVSPAPNSPDTLFATTPPGHVYKWSTLDPSGTCNGTTFAPPTGTGAPLPPHLNRIEGGWYLLPGTQGYYGADRTGHALAGALTGQGLLFGIDDACGPTGKLAYDSASLADPDIDYNDFDTDKDGIVDFFNLVFAGDGGNGTTTPSGLNNVWPHSSDLRSYFTDANGETGYVSNDQFRNRLNQPMFWTNASRTEMTTTDTGIKVFVRVGPYNVNPESAVDSVSVIAHEYGHSLGLPDFYSTGTRGTFGSWELMGSDHFQYMTVFSRQDLGWLVPRPLTTGQANLRESKFDTGEIHWTRPDGTPYTLTGPGIHNADVYRLQLPPRILIDEVPSGVRAWYSQAGNDFGCPNDGGGHNMDFFIPDLQQHEGATVTLKFKHLYEIEWDYDYAFVLVSRDGGETWESLANGNTTPAAVNPNANSCQSTYGNSFTGPSDGDSTNDTEKRALADYSGAMFVEETFDMSAYAGDNVILRFSYSTDPGLAKRGWFIDDVEITAGSTAVYKSDFEESDERTRIFPDGWVRVSSADGSPADHAFYLELRDRISNDFNGKGQSDRGVPTWEGGVSMIYTDEAHGYGNFGVDDPPAQTPVDSAPQPGNATPNLDDAAFTLGRPTFNSCTHIENYDAEAGTGTSVPWILPRVLNFTITGINGLSPGAALPASPATATLIAEINPNCSIEILPPVLSLGSDYQNPDPDGAYTLNWTRPATAVGPDLLQIATICGPTFTEDAESGLGNWEVTTEGTYAGVNWSIASNNEKPNHSSATFRARGAEGASNASAIMTYKNPLVIPEGGSSTLTWDDWSINEGDDGVFVEVSDGGGTWTTIFTQARSALAPDAAVAFADEPLFRKEADLVAYRGKTIFLRFRYRLGPDNRAGSTPFGWYVDNIALNFANWADLTSTPATTFLDQKPAGSYCYRVRSTFLVGGALLPSAWSNIVTTQVGSGVLPPARLQNISARARVLTNDNVLFGGFIIRDAPKRVILRAIGPSLQSGGTAVPGRMTDPTLDLYQEGKPTPINSNDDWQTNKTEVEQTNLAPTDTRESAIVATLEPGAYTTVMKGKNGETGIGLVEVYDLDAPNSPAVLRNLSARAFVDTDDNVLIGGFIAGPSSTSATRVIVRAIGPSLQNQLPEALEDTTLEVRDANGSPVTNDDWEQSPDAAAIQQAGLAPTDPRESAVMLPSLAAGQHTAIVRGKGDPRGIGVIEIYNLN